MDNKDLIEKFIEGSLSEKESSALFEELNHNSELTDELQKSLYMDELLEQSFNEEKSDEVFIAELTEKLKDENRQVKQRSGKFNKLNTNKVRRVKPVKRKKSSSPILIFSAIAACLAVGLTILILSKSSPNDQGTQGQQISSNLYIQDIKGTVSINRNGNISNLQDGDFILKGDVLSAGSNSTGSLYFISEKTKVILNSNSKFSIDSDIGKDEKHKVFDVMHGRIYFNVAHQNPGFSFTIKSGKADSKVIGTRLEVNSDSQASTVKVFEGLVRVTSKIANQVVDVPGNHMVNIADDSFPNVQSITGKRPQVLGFTLVNAKSDTIITGYEVLKDGTILKKAEMPRYLSIRINASNYERVDGVRATLRNSKGNLVFPSKYEKVLPYTMTGDTIAGDYNEWEPAPGEYILDVDVFDLNRNKTDSSSLTFTIQ